MYNKTYALRNCVMVARQTLTLFVWVQILVPQPTTSRWLITNGSTFRGVAQFGRALGSGPRGRVFESPHSDQQSSDAAYASELCFIIIT